VAASSNLTQKPKVVQIAGRNFEIGRGQLAQNIKPSRVKYRGRECDASHACVLSNFTPFFAGKFIPPTNGAHVIDLVRAIGILSGQIQGVGMDDLVLDRVRTGSGGGGVELPG
jgi:hypothetical protein